MSDRETRSLVLKGEAETRVLGAAFAPHLRPGDLICLSGPLGSGKTTWARGLIQSLQNSNGVKDEIVSPTFTLMQNYETEQLAIFHFDLYRIEHELELLELGFDDAIEEGAVLVEWPDRLGGLILDDRIDIRFSGTGEHRKAEITGHGLWASRLRIMVFEGLVEESSND